MKRLIKKQIIRFGQWKHPAAPGGVLKITKDIAQTMIDNFRNVVNTVPVFRGHQENSDAEADPNLILAKNVQDMEMTDKGIDAVFEIDDDELDKYNDVSISIDPNYEDHETGKAVGPVIQHIGMVLNPYIKRLDPFMKLAEEKQQYLIMLSDIMTNKKSTEAKVEAAETEEKSVEVVDTAVEAKEVDATEGQPEEAKQEEVAETTRACHRSRCVCGWHGHTS